MSDLELRAIYQRLVDLKSEELGRKCVSEEGIMALAETILPEEERLELLTHVSECSSCQRELAMARALVEARESESSPVHRRAWIYGGVAAAAVLAFAALTLGRGRSGEIDVMRGDDANTVAITPVGSVSDSAGAVTFVWHAVPRTTRYDVEVLTNAGGVVYTSSESDTSFVLPPQVQLARGTEYLWRVTAQSETGAPKAFRVERFRIR